MIDRYTRPAMGKLWSEESRLQRLLDVEIAAVAAWEKLGQVPSGTADRIRASARIDPARIAEIERITDHDVAAFVQQIQETVDPDDARWIHFGLTSNDVTDTAWGMALRDSCDLLLAEARGLVAALTRRALEHRDTPCMGRSHGIHAELTTFGAKLATHAFEIARHVERLRACRERIAVGTISGPVGTYASIPPDVEEHALARLGLTEEEAPTQIVCRDRHAEYLAVLAGIGASAERLALEIRHLARTEVREVEEPFDEDQKGSSSMPHKRNPKRAERVSGLARLLRGYALAGWENVPLWHERDISHSSAERVALPDASIACDFLLADLADLVERLVIYPERMRASVDLSHGLVFSQQVLLALVDAGRPRDEAYRIVQSNAMRAWDENRAFLELLKEDTRVSGVDLDRIFDERRFLANLGVVFERLGSLAV